MTANQPMVTATQPMVTTNSTLKKGFKGFVRCCGIVHDPDTGKYVLTFKHMGVTGRMKIMFNNPPRPQRQQQSTGPVGARTCRTLHGSILQRQQGDAAGSAFGHFYAHGGTVVVT